MPPAARITDNHTCPKVDPPAHVGGPTITGDTTVLIGFQPAARISDKLVSQGEPTVIIGNQPAARLGDATTHGGKLVQGCPTVLIGSAHQSGCILAAAASGAPFVEQGP
jgi:uncharacterized Zn-binding protein involved in type VI secretion